MDKRAIGEALLQATQQGAVDGVKAGARLLAHAAGWREPEPKPPPVPEPKPPEPPEPPPAAAASEPTLDDRIEGLRAEIQQTKTELALELLPYRVRSAILGRPTTEPPTERRLTRLEQRVNEYLRGQK